VGTAHAQQGQQGQQAADPYAFAQPYRNIAGGGYEAYNADVMRSGGSSVNPLADSKGIQLSDGSGLIVDPFNPGGKPLTRSEFATLKGRMAITHSSTIQDQVQAYRNAGLSAAAGGTGVAPVSAHSINTGKAEAPDKAMLQNPQAFSKAERLAYDKKKKQIRTDWARMNTNLKGVRPTYKELSAMADQLTKEHPKEAGFVAQVLSERVNKDGALKEEFNQLRLEVPEQGNPIFQQKPPEEQSLMREYLKVAQTNGFMHPDMLQALGFRETADKQTEGGTGYFKADGRTPIDATDVAARAQALWGIGGAEDTTGQRLGGGFVQNAATGDAVTSSGTAIYDTPASVSNGALGSQGIIGVRNGPEGKIVDMQGGIAIEERNANIIIKSLEKRGDSESLADAKALKQAFGISAAPAAAPAAPAVPPTIQPVVDKVASIAKKKRTPKETDWLLEALNNLANGLSIENLKPASKEGFTAQEQSLSDAMREFENEVAAFADSQNPSSNWLAPAIKGLIGDISEIGKKAVRRSSKN